MKRHTLRFSLYVLALVSLMGVHSTVQAQSADQVYNRLKQRYKTIQTVRAQFSQTMKSDVTGESSSASGTVLLQGNKYRVETGSQTMVTDGRVTWVYLPADKKVLVNDYVQDETTFTLGDFLFDYADRYRVTGMKTATLDGQKHYLLTLKAKDEESYFTDVTVSMRDRDNLVTRLQVVDVNGTAMDFSLRNIEVNPRVAAGAFTFQPPKNVEVVDLRS